MEPWRGDAEMAEKSSGTAARPCDTRGGQAGIPRTALPSRLLSLHRDHGRDFTCPRVPPIPRVSPAVFCPVSVSPVPPHPVTVSPPSNVPVSSCHPCVPPPFPMSPVSRMFPMSLHVLVSSLCPPMSLHVALIFRVSPVPCPPVPLTSHIPRVPLSPYPSCPLVLPVPPVPSPSQLHFSFTEATAASAFGVWVTPPTPTLDTELGRGGPHPPCWPESGTSGRGVRFGPGSSFETGGGRQGHEVPPVSPGHGPPPAGAPQALAGGPSEQPALPGAPLARP